MKSNPNFGFFKINGESKLFPFLRFIFVAFLASFFFTAFTGCGKNKEDHFEPYFKENLFWINFPIILHADARFIEDPKSGEDLRVAIRFWEKKAGRRLFQISPKPSHFSPFSNPLNPNYSLENSIFFLNPWPFDHEVAGKTLVQMNGPKIQHAVIYLNSETALCHSLCNGEIGRAHV